MGREKSIGAQVSRALAPPTPGNEMPSLKQMMESQNHQIGLIDTVVYELEREFDTSRPEGASPKDSPQTLVEQTLVNGARLHEIWERLSAVRNAVGG